MNMTACWGERREYVQKVTQVICANSKETFRQILRENPIENRLYYFINTGGYLY